MKDLKLLKKSLSCILTLSMAATAIVALSFGKVDAAKIGSQSDSSFATCIKTPTEEVKNARNRVTSSYRTIMYYIIGSDLESVNGIASGDLMEIAGADISSNTNVIIQTGGCSTWYNNTMQNGEVQRFKVTNGGFTELENLGSLSMVEGTTLTDFIEFCKTNYPAQNYDLVFWDHGGGLPVGFGVDDLYEGSLTCVDIGNAIEAADIHYDSIIFSCCQVCSIEMLMSIKDYTDYVIAAENCVWGMYSAGLFINHNEWLPVACDETKTTVDYLRAILDGYVENIEGTGCLSSMAILEMDKMDAVFTAYNEYFADIYMGLQDSSYSFEQYCFARNSCIISYDAYYTFDSIDLYNFCSSFETDYSQALMDAIDDAVVDIESSLPYEHGMTFYSVWDIPEGYPYVRDVYLELGYDDTVIEFYDGLASLLYYYKFNTDENYEEEVEEEESWYEEPEEVEETNNEEFYIDYEIDDQNNITIPIGEDVYYTLTDARIEIWEWRSREDIYYTIGTDIIYTYDEDYNVYVELPETTLSVCGYKPSIFISYCLYDKNEVLHKGYYVMAYVNGEEALLLYTMSSVDSTGEFVGYYLVEFDDIHPGTLYQFNDDDEIQLAAKIVIPNEDSTEFEYEYWTSDRTHNPGELTTTWTPLGFGRYNKAIVCYIFRDIYNNQFRTESFQVN